MRQRGVTTTRGVRLAKTSLSPVYNRLTGNRFASNARPAWLSNTVTAKRSKTVATVGRTVALRAHAARGPTGYTPATDYSRAPARPNRVHRLVAVDKAMTQSSGLISAVHPTRIDCEQTNNYRPLPLSVHSSVHIHTHTHNRCSMYCDYAKHRFVIAL